MTKGNLKFDKNATAAQGFAPIELISVAAGSVDTTEWLAFCFPNDEVSYQINGTGEVATLSAGTIRVVNASVDSITFSGFTTAICEVM